MPKKIRKPLPIHQSCLYKINSRKRLAEILFTTEKKLIAVVDGNNRYETFKVKKKDGAERPISAPNIGLKIKQKRLASLLHGLAAPDYVMAPVKGRSYVDNAARHVGQKEFCLLDVANFFPSCTDKRVFWFFSTVLKCSRDVAAILTRLTTEKGCLPQGSPCSPALAYWSYCDMWDAINDIAVKGGCRLTLYADDITISASTHIRGSDVWAIKRKLERYGLAYKIEKERRIRDKPVPITGCILRGDKLLLPNRQHKALAEVRAEMRNPNAPNRTKIRNRLRGRETQAKQILGYHDRKEKAVTALEPNIAVIVKLPFEEGEVPWK
ncbi:MAG: reverse transcriptase family protein [Litorimonas sp.]